MGKTKNPHGKTVKSLRVRAEKLTAKSYAQPTITEKVDHNSGIVQRTWSSNDFTVMMQSDGPTLKKTGEVVQSSTVLPITTIAKSYGRIKSPRSAIVNGSFTDVPVNAKFADRPGTAAFLITSPASSFYGQIQKAISNTDMPADFSQSYGERPAIFKDHTMMANQVELNIETGHLSILRTRYNQRAKQDDIDLGVSGLDAAYFIAGLLAEFTAAMRVNSDQVRLSIGWRDPVSLIQDQVPVHVEPAGVKEGQTHVEMWAAIAGGKLPIMPAMLEERSMSMDPIDKDDPRIQLVGSDRIIQYRGVADNPQRASGAGYSDRYRYDGGLAHSDNRILDINPETGLNEPAGVWRIRLRTSVAQTLDI